MSIVELKKLKDSLLKNWSFNESLLKIKENLNIYDKDGK